MNKSADLPIGAVDICDFRSLNKKERVGSRISRIKGIIRYKDIIPRYILFNVAVDIDIGSIDSEFYAVISEKEAEIIDELIP